MPATTNTTTIVHSEEEERAALASLPEKLQRSIKTFQEKADPDHKRSINVLTRFLVLAKMDIQEAEKLMGIFDEVWQDVDSKASDEDVLRELKTEKYQLGGLDDKGRGVMQVFVKKHLPADFEVAVMIKTTLLIMDMVMSDMSTAQNGLVWVCWMEGTGWNNFNFELQTSFAKLFQNFGEPAIEFFGEMRLVDAPWWCRLAVAMMRPFVGDVVASRLVSSTTEETKDVYRGALSVNESFYEKMKAGELYRWK